MSTKKTDSTRYASIAESNTEDLKQLKRDYELLLENAEARIITDDSEKETAEDYETQTPSKQATYNDKTYELRTSDELSMAFFHEFAGRTSGGERVPEFVFHLPKEKKDIFLDAVSRESELSGYSNGYVDNGFNFKTTSRQLAAGISLLLIQRGKNPSFKYHDETYTVGTHDYQEGRGPVLTEIGTDESDGYVYDLSVAENQNFVDGIGGIVLHNTDSTLVELGPDQELDQILETGEEIEEKVNESYDDFALEEFNAEQHRWEIEFEKVYRRFFQAGKKKRYAGHLIWREGQEVDEVDITGFEYKRSDVARITKDVQEEVIRRIVKGEDFESVAQYLRDIIENFKHGEYDYGYVGIPGGIGKKLDNYETDTAHVKGAKYANEHLGTNFMSGSKPKRLYIKRVKPSQNNYPPTDVVCFEYPEDIPEEFEVDWDKMLDKTLKRPISRILEALEWSWSEVESGHTQSGLSQFT